MDSGKFPIRVLVVDDEPLIRWSLKESLLQAGFAVVDVGNGHDALAQLNSVGDIEAVLLDLKLPDLDGLTILRQIKSHDPSCQVIIMTAYGLPETVDEAAREGAYLTVHKPFNIDEMVGLVGKAIEAR
ncbi:MAG: response regulator [Acidobacteria bacterium]|nr:response regulator [Acidobacteriota bacterium]